MTETDDATVHDEIRGRDVPLAVITVGIVVIAWWPAFTLGAWGEIFFDDILALWAASTAALVFVLIERRPWVARLRRAVVLLVPSIWLVLNFIVDDDTADLGIALLDLSALAAVILGIPFTLWVLVRIMWPDVTGRTTMRSQWLIGGVVFALIVASFVLGLNESRFLTCDDFAVSGNSQPTGCTPSTN